MGVVVQAVAIGMVVVLAGTIPRNIIFAANLRYYPSVPCGVPFIAAALTAGETPVVHIMSA